MQHSFLRRLIIISLLLTTALTTALTQDEPTVTVTPDSGVVGVAIMDISVSGLVADRAYTIEFVYDGAVVFAVDEVADSNGTITFDAASTPDDEAGLYTLQVLSRDSIVATAQFELTADKGEATDTSPIEEVGNIHISPKSGPISTLHTITLSDLEPNRAYTVEIIASKTEEVVYRRIWTSDKQGNISIELFARDGDTTGQQVVSVFDDSGSLVARGDFTIDEPPTRNAVVDVTPPTAQSGSKFTITVSGLVAFDNVRAQITSPDNILLDTLQARASSQGVAVLSFMSPDDLEEDIYTVSIFVEDIRMAEATLTIDNTRIADDNNKDADENDAGAEPSKVTLTVDPEAAPIGGVHVMTVTGLEPEQPFTLTISSDAGDIEYTTTRIADASGQFSINISSSEGDEIGTYPVTISDATTGKVLATAQMIIEGDDTPEATATDTTAITVSPTSGEIGTTYVITLSGMPANTRVGVVIRAVSDNTLALSSVVEADENGGGTVEFTSRELNSPGDYTVAAVQPLGELASTRLTIEGATATIEPQAGEVGTTHLITVIGLNPNETVTFDVTFDGESVLSTERTANANGETSLSLTTEASDALGDYTITVLRESGNQPTVILTLTGEEEATLPPPTEEDKADEPIVSADAQVIEGRLSDGLASIPFEGEEGQYVIIRVESEEFDTVATVYDDDFYEIAYNDDSFGRGDSRIGPLLLPYSGEYTLEVSQSYYEEDETSGGEFVATIEFVSVASLNYDEPTAFTLSPQTPARYYELPVEAGDSLTITVESEGALDTVMQVLSYDGYEFAFDDDSGAGFDAEFNNLIFDFADTYILVLSSFSGDASGDGTLLVSRNPVKSLDEGAVTVTLNDKVYQDIVVFEGEKGQVITLNLEKLSGDVEDLYIYATVDGMEVMSYSTMGVPDKLPLAFVMPVSGQVIVSFEEYSFGSGISFNVSVEKE